MNGCMYVSICACVVCINLICMYVCMYVMYGCIVRG